MAPVDFSQAQAAGKGFQFPGEFEITAVGSASADPVSVRLQERAMCRVEEICASSMNGPTAPISSASLSGVPCPMPAMSIASIRTWPAASR